MLASVFLGLALYMTPTLWRQKPLGTIGEQIRAMLPLDSRGPTVEEWDQYAPIGYEEVWEKAIKEGKLIFIDFTGVNCPVCRLNEDSVFSRPAVRKELDRFLCVRVYTDSVPDPALGAARARELATRNQNWQSQTFGEFSTPLYVVFKPNKEKMEEDGKLLGEVLSKQGGPINDVQQFIDGVLKKPLETRVAEAR
jgi:thiol:disulfide interchange protein